MTRRLVLAVVVSVCAAAPAADREAAFQARHLWVRWQTNAAVDANVAKTVAMLERAAKAGYTGMVLVENRLRRKSGNPQRYFDNLKKIRAAADRLKIELHAAVLPMGYANDLLSDDPDLAAGMPVVDAPFVVRGGKIVPDDPTALVNGTFAKADGDQPAGWTVDRPGKTCFIDRQVTCNGLPSLRMVDPADNPDHAHARAWQKLQVKPWRYYYFSVALKTEGLTKPGDLRLMALGNTGPHRGAMLNIPYLYAKPTQDWTRRDLTFNTRDFTEVTVYVGTWSAGTGKMWWADVRLEPAGLVNVLRRPGTPVKATADDGKTALVEGKDLPDVRDGLLGRCPYKGGYRWHAHPDLPVPAGSRLKEGDRLLLSYYHTALMCYNDQVPICMAEPQTNDLIRWHVGNVARHLAPDGYFMMHDEIRMQGWCAACRKSGKTCGQVLADNTRVCVEAIRQADPGKGITVWSDMYDKTHNAKPTGPYALVRGDGPWAGSWEGLDKSVGVMNWSRRPASLKWFASRGHEQIVSDNRPGGIVKVLRDAADVPGIVGVMYTTWSGDYSDLEAYAAAVKAHAADPAAAAPAPKAAAVKPAPAATGKVIADMDTIRHKPGTITTRDKKKVPAGTVELVAGKVGKACKFTFRDKGRSGLFNAWVPLPPEADAAGGFSFWVKGDGSRHFGGIQLIDGSDYALRYGYCFPLRSTEWTKITVPWRDLIPELAGPLVDPKTGYKPSGFKNVWVGKWFYWREYPGYSVAIDQIALEPTVQLDETDYTPEAAGLPRLLARLKAGKAVTIVTMGDSLSDKRHWANRKTLWSELLVKKLKDTYGSDATLVNPAIGGTNLTHNLVLMPRWLADTPRPDLVTVCFGYNDWSSKVRGPRFKEYLRLAVDRIRRMTKGSAEVLLITTCPAHGRWRALDEMAKAAHDVAKEKRTGFADIATRFHAAGSPGEALKRQYWARDKTHLGEAGHQLVAETVLKALAAGGADFKTAEGALWQRPGAPGGSK